MSGFVCPCGCGLQLSQKDLAMSRWLEEIAGERTGNEARINLSTSPGVSCSQFSAPEPTVALECDCGAAVPVAEYIAEFLSRWGMGRPSCEHCHTKANRRAS